MKIIASYNVKGGVGKTATAVNLAYLAAAEGRRTLIWDLDPQAAATFLFRIRPKVKGGSDKLVKGRRRIADAVKGTDFADLDLLPADFTYRNMDIDLVDRPRPTQTMRRLLAPLAKEYDLVILDTPPSLSLVSENVLHAADLVLVPIIPTVLSVRTFDQLTQFVKEFKGRKPRLLGFFSMVDRRRALHREIVDTLPTQRKNVTATAIPAASTVEQMAVRRSPVVEYAPRSPAALAYAQLWDEASAELWGR